MTTYFDLSFGYLQVVSSTLENAQLRGIKVYNILRWVIRPEDDQIKGQNMSS